MTEFYRRDFPAELQVRRGDDGEHYAEGLCVPYGVAADIIEIRDGEPIRYRERFAAGAFARALRAPHRITLVYGHGTGFSDRLGHVTELSEDATGLRMRAKIDRSRAEQAIDALTSSHSALSVAFATIVPKYGTEEPGSLVTRVSVHLDHIGAVTQGAYDAARLTSVRGDQDPDPEPTPAELAAAEQERKQRELLAWVDELASEDPWAHLRV
jgi:HK97 family phage prohead protease